MKKASYKRCFLYVIIIPKGDIMNTKYNIIISTFIIILLIILKIINYHKYKNNEESLLLKKEKRNTKIFFIISILLFIFSLIFNKYINDYSLINNILSSLSILLMALPITNHNLYKTYFKDEDKFTYIKTIITTKKVKPKLLKEINRSNINVIIVTNKDINSKLPIIKPTEINIKEMRKNNIIKTNKLSSITKHYNESNGFYITDNIEEAYENIINSRGILDNYQKASKYNLISSIAIILSSIVINNIYQFPYPYYLSIYALFKLLIYINTTYVYKNIKYDNDIKTRYPLDKNIKINKQELFINIFQIIIMTIGITMPYMYLLASGTTILFGNTVLFITIISSLMSFNIANISEDIYLKNIFKILKNKYLIIYTLVLITFSILIYYIPIFNTKEITYINVIASILVALLTTIPYDIFKLARYTSTKGTKKYDKNNKKHRRS